MRSIYVFLVAVILLGLVPAQVFAGDQPIHVILDGKEMDFPAPPRIENGTTLVPFRTLFEAVEMEVLWDGETQTITAEGNQKELQLRIGDDKATNNGQTVELESSPQLIEGSAYVPLRFVGEALDYLVDYRQSEGSVSINLRTSALRLPLSRDPYSLNPAVSNDNISYEPLIGLFEGLVRSTENGDIAPAAASSWDISEDRKSYTFYIRPDAVWSNGDPVTAQDFSASWKRVVDLNASLGADFLSHIDQVKAYRAGKTTWEETGIQVESDKTLVIRMEQPVPYFLELMAEISLVPVHADARELSQWSNDPLHFVSNGPFTLESWRHGKEITLKKNSSFHSASEIFFPKVKFVILEKMTDSYSPYQNNELDWADPVLFELNNDDSNLLQQDQMSELFIKSKGITYYYLFNLTQKPFNNVKVRKALTMGVDADTIVRDFFQENALLEVRPAHSIIPPAIKGEKTDFRNEYPDFSSPYNVTEAQSLLKEGLKEEGVTTLSPITITVNEGVHYIIAVNIAKMWKENLGIESRILIVKSEAWLNSQRTLKYQIIRAGYSADYNDPTTFLDMWGSGSSLNHSGFKDESYDQMLLKANITTDTHERMRILAEAEKYLIEEQAVIMPVYYYPNVWIQKKNIHNIKMNYNGTIDYTRSYYKP
jgi:oligopeptide transport system substrate-binding protein